MRQRLLVEVAPIVVGTTTSLGRLPTDRCESTLPPSCFHYGSRAITLRPISCLVGYDTWTL